MGYTYASVGSGGPLSVQPRENRFGNEFLVNQLAIVLEKTLKKDEFNWGFKSVYYAGADASLLTPLGGFRNSDPRFGHDFRDLYVSAHLPVLTQGGIDVRVGRMTTIVGYESALAPYRPFYSNDYQWFYSQDGAFTGALATFHLNDRLNVTHGVTMGANTFFRNRSGACYLGQINYWTDCEKNTLFNSSIYVGDDCIFAAPGRDGDLATVLELRIQHKWSKYLTQIVQSDMGWDRNIPNIGTGSWYSLYSIWVAHATPTLDVNLRAEWFRDIFGTRTGIDAHYAEVTLGLDWHPKSWLRIRPEIRGDFANRPAFGVRGPNDYSQLTLAIDALLSF